MFISRRMGKIAGLAAVLGLGLLCLAQGLDLVGLAFWPQQPVDPSGPPPSIAARLAAMFLLGLGTHLVAGRAYLERRLFMPVLYDIGIWLTTALALLRAVGNFRDLGFFRADGVSDWATLDIWFISPLFVAIALACLVTALSPREYA